MEKTRIFKYKENDSENYAFVISNDESKASDELSIYTLKIFKLVQTIFLEDLPGYSELEGKTVIIKNEINPF